MCVYLCLILKDWCKHTIFLPSLTIDKDLSYGEIGGSLGAAGGLLSLPGKASSCKLTSLWPFLKVTGHSPKISDLQLSWTFGKERNLSMTRCSRKPSVMGKPRPLREEARPRAAAGSSEHGVPVQPPRRGSAVCPVKSLRLGLGVHQSIVSAFFLRS